MNELYPNQENPAPAPQKLTQSLGQRRVRVSFNPSANSLVDDIKAKSAELIDMCDQMRYDNPSAENASERARCCALAMTHYEDAAMWAVKAATA